MIPFSKYEGSGNDFILLDQRQYPLSLSQKEIAKLCHRQQGIGADGVVTLTPSHLADWKMDIYNADGSFAEMCGNAMRCFGRFLIDLNLPKKKYFIEINERILPLDFIEDQVKVWMGLPLETKWEIALLINNKEMIFDYLDTGVPHAVCLVENVDLINLNEIGPVIRNHHTFSPRGVNATFASWNENFLKCRTYERGVEKETLACGTGAMAAAFSFAKRHPKFKNIPVLTHSKKILIANLISEPTLSGPAEKIFDGQFHESLITIENL